MKKILGIQKGNFITYLISMIISIILCSLYFINPTLPVFVLCSSIGASGIGAVILAYFLDLVSSKKENHVFKGYISNLQDSLASGYCAILSCLQREKKDIIFPTETNMRIAIEKNFIKIMKDFKMDIYKTATLNKPITEKEVQFLNQLKLASRNMGHAMMEITDIYSHRFEFISNDYLSYGEVDSLWAMNNQLRQLSYCERVYDFLNTMEEFCSWNIEKISLSNYTLEYNPKTKQYQAKTKNGDIIF